MNDFNSDRLLGDHGCVLSVEFYASKCIFNVSTGGCQFQIQAALSNLSDPDFDGAVSIWSDEFPDGLLDLAAELLKARHEGAPVASDDVLLMQFFVP